jgi:hypothetical protein
MSNEHLVWEGGGCGSFTYDDVRSFFARKETSKWKFLWGEKVKRKEIRKNVTTTPLMHIQVQKLFSKTKN